MSETKTGWAALAGQWTTVGDDMKTVYSWDGRFWPTAEAAIVAGYELANGTDDFNVAQVDDGTIVWWGWMTEAHALADAEEAAEQFGWSVAGEVSV